MPEEEIESDLEEKVLGKTMAKKKDSVKMPKMNSWMIISILLIVVLVGVLIYFLSGTSSTSNVLKPEEAAVKAIKFINENLVQPNTTASFVSVTDFEGVYNVTTLYQGRNISLFVTKDGTYMFLSSPLDITQALPLPETEQPQEVPKTDKPEAHVFVMSYCPFGIQFLTAYTPVIEFFGAKADLQVNFVNYIMHEEKEISENNRMYCIQKEQNDKLTTYLSCFVSNQDSESCIAEAKIDKTKLQTCMNNLDKQFNITGLYNDNSTWKSGIYPQYPVDDALIKKFALEADGSFGSPTFVLNGLEISVQRTPDAIKEAICSAFITPPSECSQQLSATGAAAAGSCG